METWDWIGIAAAIAAVAAAVYAGRQAKAAKSQANSAMHQVELMKKQVAISEEANRLTEKALGEEREARSLKLDVSAQAVKRGDLLWLEITIENNCQLPANIQDIAAVSSDGSRHTRGRFGGEITLSRRGPHMAPWLPGELMPGQTCTFTFVDYRATDPLSGDSTTIPPDYDSPLWKSLERVEVKANNKLFLAEEGDGQWLREFHHRGSSSAEPEPRRSGS